MPLSRREFICSGTTAAGGLLLAGCSGDGGNGMQGSGSSSGGPPPDSPAGRLKRLARNQGYSPEYVTSAGQRVSIVGSAQWAPAGTLSSGILIQGANPGDQAGMRFYTFAQGDGIVPGGTNPDGSAVDTTLASRIGGFNSGSWTAAGLAGQAFGSAILAPRRYPRAELVMNFQTNAAVIGVVGGWGNNPISPEVWIDTMDGQGNRSLTPLEPLPTTYGFGSTIYFILPSGDAATTASKKIIVVARNFNPVYGLCLPGDASLDPVAFETVSASCGVIGDSISASAFAAMRKCRVFGNISQTDGGTGYATPLNYTTNRVAQATLAVVTGVTTGSSTSVTVELGGAAPFLQGQPVTCSAVGGVTGLNNVTAVIGSATTVGNACTFTIPLATSGTYTDGGYADNTDANAALPSACGNVGWPTSRLANTSARTDTIVAARPDCVVIAHGINDQAQALSDNAMVWDLAHAVGTVLSRLRTGLPDAVLVVVSPWTGPTRGPSGLTGGVHNDHDDVDKNKTVINALGNIAGPWVFISNLNGVGLASGNWTVCRADGSMASGSSGSAVWVRGNGHTDDPANDSTPPDSQDGNDATSNAGWLIGGSGGNPHPTQFAATSLAVDWSGGATMTLSSVAGLPYSGTVSVQSTTTGALSYAHETQVAYTSKTIATNTLNGCAWASGPTSQTSGANVYSRFLTIPDGTFFHGYDYLGWRIAVALDAAIQQL